MRKSFLTVVVAATCLVMGSAIAAESVPTLIKATASQREHQKDLIIGGDFTTKAFGDNDYVQFGFATDNTIEGYYGLRQTNPNFLGTFVSDAKFGGYTERKDLDDSDSRVGYRGELTFSQSYWRFNTTAGYRIGSASKNVNQRFLIKQDLNLDLVDVSYAYKHYEANEIVTYSDRLKNEHTFEVALPEIHDTMKPYVQYTIAEGNDVGNQVFAGVEFKL
ncbi:hypothetical protein MM5_189 [Morganella phage vB_Mm5]